MTYPLLLSLLFYCLTACALVIPDCYPLLKHTEEITKKFMFITSKTDQLQLFMRGSSTNQVDVPIICIGVIKLDLLTVDETRILVVSKVEQLLEIINNYEAIHPYLNCYPATIKNLDFSINFKTKNIANPDEPYVAHAYLQNGKIYYNSGEIRKLILVEPYETALQWVKENAPWALEQG